MPVQIVHAPGRPPIDHSTKLFLAGTTPAAGRPDWRETIIAAVRQLPVTVLDPVRPDWDSSWREDASFAPFREQVAWELDMQEAADIIAFFFDPAKDGTVSLLELGLCARSQKAIVACPQGYTKRGNVQMVCERFGIDMVDSAKRLGEVVVERIQQKQEVPLGGGRR